MAEATHNTLKVILEDDDSSPSVTEDVSRGNNGTVTSEESSTDHETATAIESIKQIMIQDDSSTDEVVVQPQSTTTSDTLALQSVMNQQFVELNESLKTTFRQFELRLQPVELLLNRVKQNETYALTNITNINQSQIIHSEQITEF